MYPDLHGGTALVTGGTSGIGRACVERLSAEGMKLVFTGRSERRGAEVATMTGAKFIQCDARDRAACDRSIEAAVASLNGRLDVLVANAGILYTGPLEKMPDAALRELIEVDMTAVFRYSRGCFNAMREQGGGTIVFIASDAGIRGIHELPAYSAAKAGVLAISELLAVEGAPHGIRSNAVCPGDVLPGVQAIATGQGDHADDPAEWTLPPSGRFGTGEDVSGLVAWLACEESSHMSGATLRLDGGTGAVMRSHVEARPIQQEGGRP